MKEFERVFRFSLTSLRRVRIEKIADLGFWNNLVDQPNIHTNCWIAQGQVREFVIAVSIEMTRSASERKAFRTAALSERAPGSKEST